MEDWLEEYKQRLIELGFEGEDLALELERYKSEIEANQELNRD